MNGFGKRPSDTPMFKNANGETETQDGDMGDPARRATDAQLAKRKIAQPRGRARVTALASASKRFPSSSHPPSSNFSADAPTNGATAQQSPFAVQSNFAQDSNPFAVSGTSISHPFSFTQSTGPVFAFGSSNSQSASPAADSAPAASSTGNATSGVAPAFNFPTTGQQSTPNPFSFGSASSSAGGTSSTTSAFQFGFSAQPNTPKHPESTPTTNPFASLSASIAAPTTPFQFGATAKPSEIERAASPAKENNSTSNLFNPHNNNQQGSSLFSSTPAMSASTTISQPSSNSPLQFSFGQPAATTTSTEATSNSASSPFKFSFGQSASSASTPPTSTGATVSSSSSTPFPFVFGQTATTASGPTEISNSRALPSTSSATVQSSESVGTAKPLFSFPQTQAPYSSSTEASTTHKPLFSFDASPAKAAGSETATEKAPFAFGQSASTSKTTADTASLPKPSSSSIFNLDEAKTADPIPSSTISGNKSAPQQQQPTFAFGARQDQPDTLDTTPGLGKSKPSSTFGFGRQSVSPSEFPSAQMPALQEQQHQSLFTFGDQQVKSAAVPDSSSSQKSTPSSVFQSGQRQTTTSSTETRSASSLPPELRIWVQRLTDIANSRYAAAGHSVTFEQVAQVMDPTGLPPKKPNTTSEQYEARIRTIKMMRLNEQLEYALETVRKKTPLGRAADFSPVFHVYNVFQKLITNEPEAWKNPFASALPNGPEAQKFGTTYGSGSNGPPGASSSGFSPNFSRAFDSGNSASGLGGSSFGQGYKIGSDLSGPGSSVHGTHEGFGKLVNAETNNSRNEAKEPAGTLNIGKSNQATATHQPLQQPVGSNTASKIQQLLDTHESDTAKAPTTAFNFSADQSKTDKQQASGKFGSFSSSGGWKPDSGAITAAIEKDKNNKIPASKFTASLSIGSSIQPGGFDPKTGGWAQKRGIDDVEAADKTSGETGSNSDQDHQKKKTRTAETSIGGFGDFKHKRKDFADSEDMSILDEGKYSADTHPNKKSKSDAETPVAPTPKSVPFSFSSTLTPSANDKVGTSTPPAIVVDGSSITRTPSPAISTSGRSSVLEGPHDNSIRSDNIFGALASKFASKTQQADDDEKDGDSDDEEETSLKNKPYTPTPGSRSLFDRVSREPSVEPAATPKVTNLLSSANGVGDRTWKPNSPIKFGPAATTSEAPSTGASTNPFANLFGASKGGTSSASADADSATMPANLGFTFGQNLATSSFNINDASNLARLASGATSVLTSSFNSATTSRATTPEGSGKEQTSADQDEAPSEPQADLFDREGLEKQFDIVAEWHDVRAYKMSPAERKWNTVGVGSVLLLDANKAKSTNSRDLPNCSMLLRTVHGRNLLQSPILPNVAYGQVSNSKDPSKKTTRVQFPVQEGKDVRSVLFTFKNADEAADFERWCEQAQAWLYGGASEEEDETEIAGTETEDTGEAAGENEVIAISSDEEDDDEDEEDGETGEYVEDNEDSEYVEDAEYGTGAENGGEGEEDEL